MADYKCSICRLLFRKRVLLLAATAIVAASSNDVSNDDLRWVNNPKQWHQQTARTVDHRFSTLAELRSFARGAKQAGVSTLMLVGVNRIGECPGSWYGGPAGSRAHWPSVKYV